MSEQSSLRERLVADLSSTNTLVILVAIVCAVPIFLAYTAMRGVDFAGGFLLLMSIGVDVPHVYERYWPVEYTGTGAIAWTIAASFVTTVLFIGLYQLFATVMDATIAAVVAFLLMSVVQFGSAIVYRRTTAD